MATIANHANLTTTQAHVLVREIRPLETIDEAIRWGQHQSIARAVLEVLVQDQRSHDLVMAWELDKHLVFDTDCEGAIRNVSVWDYRPSPEEILQMRISSGWRPMEPSESSGAGGHASETCRVLALGPS